MPELRHYDHLGSARFVTFTCFRRLPLLAYDPIISIFIDELAALRQRHRVTILGYVVMPEHIHLVLLPPDDVQLGRAMGHLKARSARFVFQRFGDVLLDRWPCLETSRRGRLIRRFWQPRCYDHNCRTVSSVVERIRYCHANPVRRGLVQRPEDWRWSSCRYYAGAQNVVLEIGAF